MRRPWFWMLLAAAAAAVSGLLWFSRDAGTDDPGVSGGPSNRDEGAELEYAEDDDHLPWSVYMERLGAVEGAFWTGRVKGGRVILHLGSVADESDESYFAVLWDKERPRVRVFGVCGFGVERNGNFGMSLAPMGRDGSSGVIEVERTVVDDVFRFTEIEYDDNGVIPPKVELERCSGEIDKEEARLRSYIEQVLKG